MDRLRLPKTRIFLGLALLQVVQMYFSTEVKAQLKWEAFASGGSNTVTVASNNAVRIHAILPGTNASTNTGILVEFGSNAPIFLSGSNFDTEAWGDPNTSLQKTATFANTTLNSVTPRGLLLLPGPLTIRKSSDSVPVEKEKVAESLASNASVNSVSASSVVVPANAVGDVDVLLEQSTDMITWTQCLPGTYNASTQKRFFRVRAVEK